jgi:hypothetical protein
VGLIPAIHEPSGKSYRNHHRDQGIAIAQKYSAKLSKKAADKKLTEVAESEVNVQAMTDWFDLDECWRHWGCSLRPLSEASHAMNPALIRAADHLKRAIGLKGNKMNILISVLITFLVVVLVLYFVSLLPIDGKARQIATVVVIIIGIVSLLKYLTVI